MKRKLIYSSHVVIQMFKRGISQQDIELALAAGVIIREYPDDKPYTNYLLLFFSANIPLHLVYALNEVGEYIIITAYQPDNSIWKDDFTVKKR